MIIAITGQIGNGKTTTAKYFEELGCNIVNVDAIGHELLKSKEIRDKIVAEFGSDILDRTLHVDREKLSERVFDDEEKLRRLNGIIHPILIKELDRLLSELRKNLKINVLDVALLVELELENKVDKIILVRADLEKMYNRLIPKYTKKQVLNIINNQKRIEKADYEIDNNGTLEGLKNKVNMIFEDILTRKY